MLSCVRRVSVGCSILVPISPVCAHFYTWARYWGQGFFVLKFKISHFKKIKVLAFGMQKRHHKLFNCSMPFFRSGNIEKKCFSVFWKPLKFAEEGHNFFYKPENPFQCYDHATDSKWFVFDVNTNSPSIMFLVGLSELQKPKTK